MSNSFRKLIGSRSFYKMVLAIVIPIIIQNAITNFVNLLDNLMVGAIGTEEMSGVAIANQLILVFNLAIFGTISGAGIFSSQFHGAGNDGGVRTCFRYKVIVGAMVTIIGILLFLLFGKNLIALYLTDTSDPVRRQDTLNYAFEYLRIMVIGLPAFMITQSYAGTLRETRETRIPMAASIIAVAVNMTFNYLLIFGKLFFPRLGVAGAAIATVLSRYVELAFIMIYTHSHTERFRFARGLYKTMRIPMDMAITITKKALPLLANELIWALGATTLVQIYSFRGLDVVAATNISSTAWNLFSTAFMSLGNAAGIIVGIQLGAGKIDTARDYCWKLVAFSAATGIFFGALLLACSSAIPMLYNTSDAVRALSAKMMRCVAVAMPVHAIPHCAYFIMRSGGKTGITFVFDSVFSWVVYVPIAYLLTRFCPSMDIVWIYLCVQMADIIKSIFGIYLLKRGTWLVNMVGNEGAQEA